MKKFTILSVNMQPTKLTYFVRFHDYTSGLLFLLPTYMHSYLHNFFVLQIKWVTKQLDSLSCWRGLILV